MMHAPAAMAGAQAGSASSRGMQVSMMPSPAPAALPPQQHQLQQHAAAGPAQHLALPGPGALQAPRHSQALELGMADEDLLKTGGGRGQE
jgi:hypothetical protein